MPKNATDPTLYTVTQDGKKMEITEIKLQYSQKFLGANSHELGFGDTKSTSNKRKTQ